MPDSSHAQDGLPIGDGSLTGGAAPRPFEQCAVDQCPGEPCPVEQWVIEHHQALYRYAYRLCGSGPDAEDLTQQVYLIAQQKAEQIRDQDHVRGWLFTILRNCYLKTVRKRQLPTQVGPDFDIQQIPEAALAAPLDTEQLQEALNDLSDEFKLVVLMFYFEHRSYREIAEQLEIPTGTVMSRLARAKAQLRGRLIDAEDENGVESQNRTDNQIRTENNEDGKVVSTANAVVTARADLMHGPSPAFHPSHGARPATTRH